MEKQSKNNLSHFFVIGIGSGINLIVSLLTTQLITRFVEPDTYGQYSLFIMYGNLLLMALCMGLDQSLVRFFYDKDSIEYKSSILKVSVIFPVTLSILLGTGFLALIQYNLITFEFSGTISFILVVYTIGLILNRISLLLLRITYSSRQFSICSVSQKILFLMFSMGWILLIKKDILLGLALSITLSVFITTLIAVFLKKEFWRFGNTSDDWNKKEYFKFGLPLILSLGLTSLFQAIDKLSLNYYCSYSDVGIYSSAMTIIHVFAIIQTTFNSVWAPMQVEHYVNTPEDTTFIQKGNQLITVIMFAFGINLILAKDLVALILGEKFRSAAQILPFLIFNPIMYTISETTNSGIGISKKSYLNIVVAAISCVINFIGNTILVPMIGPRGAAISTGISYIVFYSTRLIISNRYYYVDYKTKKMSILIAFVIIFALHETFYSFSLVTVLLYLLCMAVLLALYMEYIKLGIVMLSKYISQFRGKHDNNME